MKHGDITKIAKAAGVTKAFISIMLNEKADRQRHPSPIKAKLLGSVTGTDPWVWLTGTATEIREAIEAANNARFEDIAKRAEQESKEYAGGF